MAGRLFLADLAVRLMPARAVSRLIPALILSNILIVAVRAQEAPPPGHERSLAVLEIDAADTGLAAPRIDGSLDDAVWQRAAPSTGFWNSVRDRPPSDQSVVFAVADSEYLYFGVRMYDADPAGIQATRTVRDGGLGYDDSITIELDTFFNRRQISKFSVNPIGTQNDEIAGGRSAKIEWKGDWRGAGARTEYGWSAEFAIPYSILNYDGDKTRFGVNFVRYQSNSRERSHWANVTPQDREEEMGYMDVLNLPAVEARREWTFMPFVLAGHNVTNGEGDVDKSVLTGGIDIRFQPRPDLTSVFSINPDFSQVERAISDISFSYAERSLDDNRPFFQEGRDYFSPEDDDEEYFYSNRVPDFDVGAKSFGRAGRAQYGLLTTIAPDDRRDFVGRALYEVDETNSAIAQIVSSNRAEVDSTLAVAQFRGRQPSGLNYSIDVAASQTRGQAAVDQPHLPIGDGNHYKSSIGWRSDYFYAKAGADKYETAFVSANGRIDEDLPGTEGRSASVGYTREFRHPVLRVVDSYIGVTRRDTLSGLKQRERVFGSGSVEFTSDIRVSLYVEDGPYRRVSDERGVFENEIFDDRYASMWVDFNTRSNRYAGGVQVDDGNLGGGSYEYVAAYGWWRPSDSVYLKLSAERIDSFGVTRQTVFESTWNISAESTLSGRYVSAGGDDEVRLAYGRRPRAGLDIFAVYDRDSADIDEVSVKVVKTF